MNHPKMKYTYVGIDSHKATHTAVLLNCFFEKLGEITFNNLPSAFPAFVEQADRLKMDDTELFFGLEDRSSYGRTLTVYLRENDFSVKHVNALLVARERKNQNIVQKTDAIDAECAARVLLSRLDSLPDANPKDDYWSLRVLVVHRQFVVKHVTALKSHLYTLIQTHYPNYSTFFANITSPTSLAFLEKYPSPHTLKKTTPDELTDFLLTVSKGRVRRQKAEEILNIIKTNGEASVQHQDVHDMAIRSAVQQIRYNMDQINETEAMIEEFLALFDCTLTTMNGIESVTAATMLSIIGDVKRFSTSAKLSRFAGIAPITYASGKKDLQFANQRGNRELNSVFYNLAVRVTMTFGPQRKVLNPFFYEYYHKKLSEGKTKRQALKCVQRRLVNIIWHMLTHHEEYINPPILDLKEMERHMKEKMAK